MWMPSSINSFYISYECYYLFFILQSQLGITNHSNRNLWVVFQNVILMNQHRAACVQPMANNYYHTPIYKKALKQFILMIIFVHWLHSRIIKWTISWI